MFIFDVSTTCWWQRQCVVHFSNNASHQPHVSSWISLPSLHATACVFSFPCFVFIRPRIFFSEENLWKLVDVTKKLNGKVKIRSCIWTEIIIYFIVHIIFADVLLYTTIFKHLLLILSI